MRPLTALLLVSSFGAVMLAGQTSAGGAPGQPAFEVASVRHNTSGAGGSTSLTPGRFTATRTQLQSLVLRVYGIDETLARFLVVGGLSDAGRRFDCTSSCSTTEQILRAHFDVNARIPEAAFSTRDSVMLMLRSLLVERFALRARLETRNIPVYALTLAREGQLGPKLRRSSQDCQAWAAARTAARAAAADTGAKAVEPGEPRNAAGSPLCTQGQFNYGQPDGLGMRGAGELAVLVRGIQEMDRPIVDRTGLVGNFEWELIKAFRMEDGRWLPPDAPPLDVALQEQLGLRLVPRTAPYDVLVIESVAMPTPN